MSAAPHAAPHADNSSHDQGHDAHGHGPTNDPRVVAVIVLLVALGAAVSLGTVAPQSRRVAGQRGAPPVATGQVQEGIVVTTDGQVAVGVVTEERALVRVRTADGERIFPRTKVRHVDARSSELGDDYYRKHGDAPIADAKYARASDGGIVILKSGQVLVGRLAISDRAITVRWPYKEQLYGGELTIPRDAVRWFKTGSDAPTQEYWQEFGDAPIHLPRPGGAQATPDRRGSQAPQETDRAEAEVAMSQGRWQEASRRWAHIARRTSLAADLENLRRCCERVLKESRSADALETALFVDDTLAGVPATPGGEGLRVHACELAITYSITNRKLEEGERWAHRLADIGPSWIEKSDQVLAGIKAIREKDAEEAAEGHEEHGEGDGHKH